MNFRSRGKLFGTRVRTAFDKGVYYVLLEDTAVSRVLVRSMTPAPIYVSTVRRPALSYFLVPFTPEVDALLLETCQVLADIRRRGARCSRFAPLAENARPAGNRGICEDVRPLAENARDLG